MGYQIEALILKEISWYLNHVHTSFYSKVIASHLNNYLYSHELFKNIKLIKR